MRVGLFLLLFIFNLVQLPALAQGKKHEEMQGGAITCTQSWDFSIMGNGIGAHGLQTLDIDHDGKTETIDLCGTG